MKGYINKQRGLRFLKFSIVGGTGYLLYILAFFGMQAIHWPELLAIALAPVANIIYNFVLHDGWTFKRRAHES